MFEDINVTSYDRIPYELIRLAQVFGNSKINVNFLNT